MRIQSLPVRRSSGGRPERGVSPVIGVVLMVAIVTALAAIVGAMAVGFEDSLAEPAPVTDFETEYDPSGEGNDGLAYLNLSFETGETLSGDRVYVVDGDGNRELWVNIWFGGPDVSPGAFVHVDGKGSDCELNAVSEGEVYRVVWERANGDRVVLTEHEIETPPEDGPDPNAC